MSKSNHVPVVLTGPGGEYRREWPPNTKKTLDLCDGLARRVEELEQQRPSRLKRRVEKLERENVALRAALDRAVVIGTKACSWAGQAIAQLRDEAKDG